MAETKSLPNKTPAKKSSTKKSVAAEKTTQENSKTSHTEAQHSTSAAHPKRLYRSHDHAVLAGVASGLGEYFDIDPAVVRLLFILSTFFGGFGIPVYLVLWVILPEKGSGDAGSEDTIKRNIDDMKDKTKEFTQNFSTTVRTDQPHHVLAFILIIAGVLFLLGNLRLIRFDLFWPLIFIIIGLAIWLKK